MHRERLEKRQIFNPKKKKMEDVEVTVHDYTNDCGFCGKECGYVTFDSERPDLTDSLKPLGYVDTRCDDCLAEQGEFKG